MSPPVIKVADHLAEAMPTARFVHMARDGRDVAGSVVLRSWGPNDMVSAIEWWADEMIAISRAIGRVSPSRVLELRMESLVGDERDLAFERLCGFLGIDDDPPMRRFFEETVTSGKAHVERWRVDRTPEEITHIDQLYDRALARMDAEGCRLPPVSLQ
jgi:hypothetical protein